MSLLHKFSRHLGHSSILPPQAEGKTGIERKSRAKGEGWEWGVSTLIGGRGIYTKRWQHFEIVTSLCLYTYRDGLKDGP